jgi:heme/copper-type cytochrome/quinol oxidase subunit 2
MQMVENIMRVISDNRFWIMSILLAVEIPVAVWMIWKMFKNGIEEFNRERRERRERHER